MSGTFTYLAYDGSAWTVNLGTSAVRLGSIPGFTEIAELGAVGTSTLEIDDPTATAGHTSDGFLAYQQFQYSESDAAIPVVFRGWTKETSYARAPGTSLITGASRRITLTLEDANTLAGRRVIPPAAVDATVNRPAETCAARITWLLGTAYFSGVADNGLVHPATATLTANDYSGAHPADVMNDCATLTGDNWFVYWDRTAAAWSLAIFDMTTYDSWTGSLLLSNDLTRIDSNLDGLWTAGPTNCWAVEPDAVLRRDSSRVFTRVYYAHATGTVLATSASTTYPVIDVVASSTSVKTAAQATTKATRYLTQSDAPADRITCRARIGTANVNDALPGQLISASFTHFPPYDTLSQFRVARRTVAQAELTDQFYTVEYELVPAVPAVAEYAVAQVQQARGKSFTGADLLVQWRQDGDCSQPSVGCYPSIPLVGPIAYDTTDLSNPVILGPAAYSGIKVTGSGTVDVVVTEVSWHVLIFTAYQTITLQIRHNGSVIASATATSDGGTGARNWAGGRGLSVSALGVSVAANDIFEAYMLGTGSMGGQIGDGSTLTTMVVSGYLVP